ncbi:hypothetical protein WI73_25505 [Burkholderia ubonensis]|nr:hypothetical protein WI40_33120 [Burkholderia ubonensis]KVC62975.1 hypothetical protein WI73_25505 [Burkholderia ubonensis]
MDLTVLCKFAIILSESPAILLYSSPVLTAGLRLPVYTNRKSIAMPNRSVVVLTFVSWLLETMIGDHVMRRGPKGTAVVVRTQATAALVITSAWHIDVVLATTGTLIALRSLLSSLLFLLDLILNGMGLCLYLRLQCLGFGNDRSATWNH